MKKLKDYIRIEEDGVAAGSATGAVTAGSSTPVGSGNATPGNTLGMGNPEFPGGSPNNPTSSSSGSGDVPNMRKRKKAKLKKDEVEDLQDSNEVALNKLV